MALRRALAALAVTASTAAAATASCTQDNTAATPGLVDAALDATQDSTDDGARDVAFDTPNDVSDGGSDAWNESASDTSSMDALSDAGDATNDAPPDGADAAPCPGTAGPVSVRVGAYCVDRTEVTNADYAQFLSVDAGALPAPPAACATHASYVPGGATWPPPAGSDALPVVAVDWCDAYVYCAWAGKRLCGAIGGGPTPFASFADPSSSAWFAACSRAGARAYPYGATYDPAACNGKDFPDGGSPRPVGALASCSGGADPTLRDLSGNVYEWEDSCDANAGLSDNCRIRGGGYLTPGPPGNINLSCAGSGVSIARGSYTFIDVGFRCCSP